MKGKITTPSCTDYAAQYAARWFAKIKINKSILLGFILLMIYLYFCRYLFPTQLIECDNLGLNETLIYQYYLEQALTDPTAPIELICGNRCHLFQTPFFLLLYRFVLLFKCEADLLFLSQILICLFGASSVLLFYSLQIRIFKDPLSAFLSSAILGFGYGFWIFNILTKPYQISYFFMILALLLYVFYPGYKGAFLSSLASAMAVGFSIAAIPFLGIMVLYIMVNRNVFFTKVAQSILYVFSTVGFFILSFFAFVIPTVGMHRLDSAANHLWRFLEMINYNAYFRNEQAFGSFFSILVNNALLSQICLPFESRCNSIVKYLLIAIIGVFAYMFFRQLKYFWSAHREKIILALAWPGFFLIAIFLIDVRNAYIYVWPLGILLLLGGIASYSKFGRILLMVLASLIFLLNFNVISACHKPVPSAEDCKKFEAENIISKGDYILVKQDNIGDYRIGCDDYLQYYFRLNMIGIDRTGDNYENFNKLLAGRLPDEIGLKIIKAIKKGKRVFFNKTVFEEKVNPTGRERFLKAFMPLFTIKDAFVLHNLHNSITYVRFYIRNSRSPRVAPMPACGGAR
ncbi:MAG: hypothetical protein V2A78_13900 [bacterium]